MIAILFTLLGCIPADPYPNKTELDALPTPEDCTLVLPVNEGSIQLGAVRFEAPEPPYVVEELRTTLVARAGLTTDEGGAADCDPRNPLRLVAWVDANEDLRDLDVTEGLPEPLVDEVVEGYFVPGERTLFDEVETSLREPVLVEEPGFLYVGFQAVGYHDSPSCILACASAPVPAFHDYAGRGWVEEEDTLSMALGARLGSP